MSVLLLGDSEIINGLIDIFVNNNVSIYKNIELRESIEDDCVLVIVDHSYLVSNKNIVDDLRIFNMPVIIVYPKEQYRDLSFEEYSNIIYLTDEAAKNMLFNEEFFIRTIAMLDGVFFDKPHHKTQVHPSVKNEVRKRLIIYFKTYFDIVATERKKISLVEWAGSKNPLLSIVYIDMTYHVGSDSGDSFNEFQESLAGTYKNLLDDHNGREIKTMSSGIVAAFHNSSNALEFILDFQAASSRYISIRASIIAGVVEIEGDDVFGNTIKLAIQITGLIKGEEIWVNQSAAEDIFEIDLPRLKYLIVKRHVNANIKGFEGEFDFTVLILPMVRNRGIIFDNSNLDRISLEASTGFPPVYIQKVVLHNISCFKNLEIQLYSENKSNKCILILGDNAAGKTTLLRSIAMAFCDEADAAALLPKDFLRQGTDEGFIRVEFCLPPDSMEVGVSPIWVENRLIKDYTGDIKLEQKRSAGFSRKRLFVSGYGPSRLSFGREHQPKYSPREAVLTLFDPVGRLMHPELVLRRMQSDNMPLNNILKMVDKVLQLPAGSTKLIKGGGISLTGPWGGDHSFTSIGGGYLSTLNWVIDLIGTWVNFAQGTSIILPSGVVILDELEQHLHPSWQREILRVLHEQLPDVQFIMTSHSAICALGTTAIPDQSQLIVLRGDETGSEAIMFPAPSAQRVDQVLTSPLFGLFSANSFGVVADIRKYAELKSIKEKTEEQQTELRTLHDRLDKALGPFEDEFHRDLERIVRETAEKELSQVLKERAIDPEILGYEIRLKLNELFHMEENR